MKYCRYCQHCRRITDHKYDGVQIMPKFTLKVYTCRTCHNTHSERVKPSLQAVQS